LSLEIPVRRHGTVYSSLEIERIFDPRSGAEVARIHQANPGLVARDLARWPVETPPPPSGRAAIFRAVADGLSEGQGAAEHREGVAATTGLTFAQVDAQVARLAGNLEALADRVADINNVPPPIAFVLPSNAPGVHTAWLAALALGHPVALKPGGQEPWTPHRLVELLVESGFPPTFFGVYPGDHQTAAALLGAAPHAVLFGDDQTVAKYADALHVDVRGPGRSKVFLTPDDLEDESLLDALIEGVLGFGGRSCLNTSTVVVAGGTEGDLYGLQGHLERGFAAVADDDLAAWTTPGAAGGIRSWFQGLDGDLEIVRRSDGLEAIRPLASVLLDASAPLARVEAPFPWVSVVAVPEDALPAWPGATLAAAVSPNLPALAQALESGRDTLRVLSANQPTTDASDVDFHLDALRQLTSLSL
jgi:hypothetical protein